MALSFRGSDVRLAVLEEKLDVYEELSREMLAKLETAVDKISEANQNVAKILVRHEERLDQSIQSDTAIIKLLEELKTKQKDDKIIIQNQINTINGKIEEISKFKWIFAGVLLVVGIVAGQVNVLESMFPSIPSIHNSTK
jgi:uncharacterized protein Smg (DUF494 family)